MDSVTADPKKLSPENRGGFFDTAPAIVWRGRWIVLWATILLTSVAAISSWLVKPQYRATVVMAAVSENSSGGSLDGAGGALMSQFGGLASMMNLSFSGTDRKAESLAVLESELLTEKFIKEKNLLPVLYAERWDANNSKWLSSNEEVPTLWKANSKFKKKVRKLVTDSKSGLSTLSVTWSDPIVAATWANDLVAMANVYMRDRTIQESERNISYLQEQLTKTTVVAVQNSIAALLENEIKRAMLANGNNEYAFKIIDPAVPPEIPFTPGKLVWVLLGVFLGLGGSIGFLLARNL